MEPMITLLQRSYAGLRLTAQARTTPWRVPINTSDELRQWPSHTPDFHRVARDRFLPPLACSSLCQTVSANGTTSDMHRFPVWRWYAVLPSPPTRNRDRSMAAQRTIQCVIGSWIDTVRLSLDSN